MMITIIITIIVVVLFVIIIIAYSLFLYMLAVFILNAVLSLGLPRRRPPSVTFILANAWRIFSTAFAVTAISGTVSVIVRDATKVACPCQAWTAVRSAASGTSMPCFLR